MVDPLSPAISIIGSEFIDALQGKYEENNRISKIIRNAAERTARLDPDHLEPAVFPALFDTHEVEQTLSKFEKEGRKIEAKDLSSAVNCELLDEEVNLDCEEIIEKFLYYLEVEMAKDDKYSDLLHLGYEREALNASSDSDWLEFFEYNGEPEEVISKVVEHGGINTKLLNAEFEERDEVPRCINYGDRYVVVGRKGAGKTRTLLLLLRRVLKQMSPKTIIVGNNDLTTIGDIQKAFSRDYSGDVLLIWDDIHKPAENGEQHIFRRSVKGLANSLKNNRLTVLASCRSEKFDTLFNYRTNEGFWGEFRRIELADLNKKQIRRLLEEFSTIRNVNLNLKTVDQLTEKIYKEDPTPFYIQSILQTFNNKNAEEVINMYPDSALDVWVDQYIDICEENTNAKRVLIALKILSELHTDLKSKNVRWVYQELLDGNPLNYSDALRELKKKNWISTSERGHSIDAPSTEFVIHDIQLESINESLQYYINRLSDVMLEDEKELPFNDEKIISINYNIGVLYTEHLDEPQINRAVQHYEEVLEKNPSHSRAHSNLGALFCKEKNLNKKAERRFKTALELDEENIWARLNYASLLVDYHDDPDSALEHLEKAISQDDTFVQAHYMFGHIHLKHGKKTIGVEYLKKAAKQGYKPAYKPLIEYWLKNKNKNEIQEIIDGYSGKRDEDPAFAKLYGKYLIKSGNEQKALDTLLPLKDVLDSDSDLYTTIAQAYIKNSQEKEGEKALETALELNPHDPMANLNYGLLKVDQYLEQNGVNTGIEKIKEHLLLGILGMFFIGNIDIRSLNYLIWTSEKTGDTELVAGVCQFILSYLPESHPLFPYYWLKYWKNKRLFNNRSESIVGSLNLIMAINEDNEMKAIY